MCSVAVGTNVPSIPIWHIGYIPQDATVDHVFYVHNTDDQPLTVTDIQTSCSCTTAGSTDSTIAPSDSLAIVVTFNSQHLVHSVRKTVTIMTDDSSSSSVRFQIEAYVLPEGEPTGIYRVSPPILSWAMADSADMISGDSIRVVNLGSDAVRVQVEACCDACVSALTAQRRIAGGSSEWIRVRGDRGKNAAICGHGSISLHFGDPEQTIITVPIEVLSHHN